MRNNNELKKLTEGEDIVKYIKAQRINAHRVVVSGGGGGGGGGGEAMNYNPRSKISQKRQCIFFI